MKKILLLLAAMACVTACGKHIEKLNQVSSLDKTGIFYVKGALDNIGSAETKLVVGNVEYVDLLLKDDSGECTFYYFPQDHPVQPTVGQKIRLTVQFKDLDQPFLGSKRVPVIQKFDYN